MKPTKLFYIWLLIMVGNTVLFTTSVFLFNYTNSVGHWSDGAWEVISVTTGLVKFVVWCFGVGGFTNKLFFKEGEHENT